MKKLFYAVILATLALAGCKKDESTPYQFEGYQWITDELESMGIYPKHQLLFDVGYTKPGVIYYAVVICEDNSKYSTGDIIKTREQQYTYSSSTGEVSMSGDALRITFISKDMIKAEHSPEDILVLNRATKRYNLKNALEPSHPFDPPVSEEFKITPEKESDWAGGSVQINANREDVTWSFEVKAHPVDGTPYQNGSLATSISDNGLLTLAMYKKRYAASVYSITDAIIVVTAETADGQTATCEVTSKAWSVKFFDNQTNWTEIDINDISSGHDISFGPYDVNGQSIEGWDGPDVGFTWNHNCLVPYGNNGVDVCADVLNMSQIQNSTLITDKTGDRYISVTYGAYENKYIIEDFR